MIGWLDLGGAALVRTALGNAAQELEPLASLESARRALATRRVDALVVECAQTTAEEIQSLLRCARHAEVPVLVVGRDRHVASAVELLRAGASDYLAAPFEYPSLGEALARLRSACAAPRESPAPSPFITADPELLATLELVRSVAATDATVLIEGESGTGKELLAHLVHRGSGRRDRELVSLNCAALPPGLLESELFGHERGAFTGAFQRAIGKFELAHGATLLLDEIGELELNLQAKLLRVIQERVVQRIGAPRPIPVDFRLVATTNRDLAQMVADGGFREDLYYRLNVVPIRVPPLRERGGDVALLAQRFAARHGVRSPQLPAETLAALGAHRWPGNVRELENLIERLAITHAGRPVTSADLPFAREGDRAPEHRSAPAAPGDPPTRVPFQTLREMERWLIVATLTELSGNRTRAAQRLGISLRTLRNKIGEYEIREPQTLPQSGVRDARRPRQNTAQSTRQDPTRQATTHSR